jgi:tRNA nucleotidyltransferase (CCA-adding enzyme)
MKIYTVGGAIRDELLGLAVKDRDHVVVGGTAEEMLALGYEPVGRDFPVFLHPQTHEEYALARTERKSAGGYRGFVIHASPEVTLEEDLTRRDLTINAIARDESTGTLIDPCGGVADLRAGILRHVGPAFVEDPVRLLRLARFAARFGFSIAPETRALLHHMVDSGEVDHLVPERVWQELSRGLMSDHPERMMAVLVECRALPRLLPDAPQAGTEAAIAALVRSARRDAPLPERLTAWLGDDDDPKRVASTADHLRAPVACRELLVLASRLRRRVLAAGEAAPLDLVRLLREADAWRRPERCQSLFAACADIASGLPGGTAPHRWRTRLSLALAAAGAVDTASIAAARPADIAGTIEQARAQAVAHALDH